MRIESTLKPFQITASLQATGSSQSDAAAMPTDCCLITSGAGGGVILPNDAQTGEVFFIANAVPYTGAPIVVYPPVGGNFVGAPANSPLSLNDGFIAYCIICFGPGVFLAAPFANIGGSGY